MTAPDTLWQFEFARNALFSALILGPSCALLGVFVTLRGQSFLSDALAHSAVTGVALGLLLQKHLGWPDDVTFAVLPFCAGLALLITWLSERTQIRPDAVITFSFAGSLALGLVILSSLDRYTLIDGILFGNIYALTTRDLALQAGLAILLGLLYLAWRRQYLLTIVQPDLARMQGVRTGLLHYALALAVALTVAVCIKMVGTLLLGALIVIPAATGRALARSFVSMSVLALLAGLAGPSLGVYVSLQRNLPTGPVIVLTMLTLLGVALLFGQRKQGTAGA